MLKVICGLHNHDLAEKLINHPYASKLRPVDVKNIVSKQIFARWQSILSCFDFKIEFIKGINNSIPDFLTREFLQGNV